MKMMDPNAAEGRVKDLLDAIHRELGMIPHYFRIMANSPVVLEGYLSMSKALERGILSPRLNQQLALLVSELNDCAYCISSHSAIARTVGMSEEGIFDSRCGVSPHRKTELALQFCRSLLSQKGHVSADELDRLRQAGYSDEGIVEMIARSILTLFTNHLMNALAASADLREDRFRASGE
jgi:uncharacterized peroxidase-related enzyme